MSGDGPAWLVEHASAPAVVLHAPWPAPGEDRSERRVRLADVDGERAIVLGSNQPASDVDDALARAGAFVVVRRSSGGGAVVVGPGEQVWVDIWVPRRDPLWDEDVIRAGLFVGRAWAEALSSIGIAGVEVHTGRLERDPWARRVCFAALGPGEVTVAGRKLVGISQRRTHHGALFHSMAPLHVDTALWARLLGAPSIEGGPPAAPPAGGAVGLAELGAGVHPGGPQALAGAVVAALRRAGADAA